MPVHTTSSCVCSVRDAVMHVSVWPSGHGCDGCCLQEGPVLGDPAGLPRAAGQRETDSHQDPAETAAKAGRQRLPFLLRGEELNHQDPKICRVAQTFSSSWGTAGKSQILDHLNRILST